MAKQSKQPKARKSSAQREHEEIVQRGLVEYTRDAMTQYGKYTLEQRAIPDFRDGLKPVHRRVIWAAHRMGLRSNRDVVVKSAAVIGEAMGKYHPHGDASLYDAMVGMVWTRQGMMRGSGNFGSLIDGPAAMRYTETCLTAYSDQVFLDKDYLAVQDMSLNYDGSHREPTILPSSLPNLLLNGAFGIAMGAKVGIPAFDPEGVVVLTKLAVEGKPITKKLMVKHLIPVSAGREGGSAYLAEDEYREELLRFFETGAGSVYWIPDAMINVKDRELTVSGFAPRVSGRLDTVLAKCGEDEYIQDILDESDVDPVGGDSKLQYRIVLRKSVPAEEVEDVLLEIQGYFEARQPLQFAVNERKINADELTDAEFEVINMAEFFQRWAKWRIDLERRSIKYQIEVLEGKLARDETLLIAVVNRDVIIKALDRDDTEAYLAKTLKITAEQVEIIMSLQVRQLKRMEGDTVKKRIAEHKASIKALKADHKDPTDRIHTAIDVAADLLV